MCILLRVYHFQRQFLIRQFVLLQDFLVFLVAVTDLSAIVVPAPHMVFPVAERTDQFVFGGRDGPEDLPLLQLFGVDPQALADVLHDRLLIIRIIDRKGVLVTKQVNMSAQDPDSHTSLAASPIMRSTRSRISPAALLVNVMARMFQGLTSHSSIR